MAGVGFMKGPSSWGYLGYRAHMYAGGGVQKRNSSYIVRYGPGLSPLKTLPYQNKVS